KATRRRVPAAVADRPLSDSKAVIGGEECSNHAEGHRENRGFDNRTPDRWVPTERLSLPGSTLRHFELGPRYSELVRIRLPRVTARIAGSASHCAFCRHPALARYAGGADAARR